MIKNIKQILFLYLRNPSFTLIMGLYLLGAILSRYFLYKGLFIMSEEAFTFMFLSVTSLAYIIGIQIKRHFANYRASFFPHYRQRHLGMAFFLYMTFVSVALFWEMSLPPSFIFTPSGIRGIYLACLCVAIIITWVGYLSLVRVFLFLYFAILILAINSQQIFHFLDKIPWINTACMLASGFMLVLFGIRLLKLKEDCFEYPFLITWPPKELIKNQLSLGYRRPGWFSFFLTSLPSTVKVKTKKYHQKRSLIARAFHWDCIEAAELKPFWAGLVLLPFYLWFVKVSPEVHVFLKNTYANFLLLSVAPVLIVVCGNYRKIVFWGYEMLKPIKKENFILQHGLTMIINLFFYWFLFILIFSILPGIVLENPFLKDLKFWMYLFLTGSYAFVVFAWIAFMSSLKSTRLVILNGFALCFLSLLQFYEAAHFPRLIILTNSILCLFIGGMFIKMTYYRWCRAEF